MPGVLGGALALLLPSVEEQFGIVVTEALSCGIPVILTPACGATVLVRDFVNGFVIDAGERGGLGRGAGADGPRSRTGCG